VDEPSDERLRVSPGDLSLPVGEVDRSVVLSAGTVLGKRFEDVGAGDL
jgi:hypothetical protein